ncbi:MAG: AMP-binding protein [Anaerosomatales bacterium]|nr:AMP-binding protein [Anaerosomatales bacterium]
MRIAMGTTVRRLPVAVRYGRAFVDEWRLIDAVEHDEKAAVRVVEARLSSVFEACRTSPFWRQHLGKVLDATPESLREALEHIEPIDKEVLRAQLDDMRSAQWTKRNSKLVSTGGTTGAQVGIWLERDASLRDWAHVVRSWGRVGFRLDEPRVVLRGVRFGGEHREVVHYEPVRRELYVSPFDLDAEHLPEIMDAIDGFGARFMHGYPSALETLGRAYVSLGRCVPKLQALLVVSENVFPDQRRRLEELFGTRVFSIYGLSERCCFASECEQSSEMHVHETYGIVELLDEEGNVITEPGVRGEIVATGLISTTMPLVRYRTGDYAAWAAGECPCGRPGPRLTSIEGRWKREYLLSSAGVPIYITAINVHSPALLRVARYRFVQERAGEATLLIQPGPGFHAEDAHTILNEMAGKLTGQVRLELEVVDEIPLSPRGKHLFIDQRIKGVHDG